MAQLLLGADSARRNRARPSASALRQRHYRSSASQPAFPDGLLAQAIERLSRSEIEDLTQSLIDRLDMMDGDCDLEDNADREANDGDSGDFAWPEWDQRGEGQAAEGEMPWATASFQWHAMTEDDEDDDPAGGNSEDEGEALEYAGLPLPIYGIDQRREPLNHRKVWHSFAFNPETGLHYPRHGRAPWMAARS